MAKRGLNKGDWKTIIENEAKLRGFSSRTVSSYLFHIGKFLDSGMAPREYLLKQIDRKKADETVRNVGFAIKFYLKVMGLSKDIEIPNVKRGKR